MSNTTCPKPNLNVKHVVTLFEEVQNRYVNKLSSIDEKHITNDERHKVNIPKIFLEYRMNFEHLLSSRRISDLRYESEEKSISKCRLFI